MPDLVEAVVQQIDIGELPRECRAVANALSEKPVQVTNFISDFQKITVTGLCAENDAAGALAAATAAVSGYTIYEGTTVAITRSPQFKVAGYSQFTVTFNVLPD
jgi:hypothetical protein